MTHSFLQRRSSVLLLLVLDPVLLLKVHIIKDLRRHLARGQPAGELDQPVGERGFPVIDVGDDRKIADMRKGRGHAAPLAAESRAVSSLDHPPRSEEHTSELQSLMRISYAVFCLKKKNHNNK